MIRISILLLLAVFWTVPAFAVVYQCRDNAGNIFLTNDRSKFPPGCVQFGETYGEQPPPPPAATAPAPREREPQIKDRRRIPALPPSQPITAPDQESKPAAPSTGTMPPSEAPQTDVKELKTGPATEQPSPSAEEEEEDE